MSLKNGDRSRSNRLRKQREKLRIKSRELRTEGVEKPTKAKTAK